MLNYARFETDVSNASFARRMTTLIVPAASLQIITVMEEKIVQYE